MNRNKLKAYAPQARRDFIKAVTDRAAYYGLTKDKIEPITEQGDVAIIVGKPFPRSVAAKRKRLEKRIRRQGFEQFMETMAYTWFNRFVAIRFMELHGYLGHGYRVLSHPEGSSTPEIVEHAEHVDLPGIDREKVIELKLEGTKESGLYRMLLIAQCNALHKAMPFLFEWIGDAKELLLPENLLHSDSLIRKLVDEIPEEDWREVEIIGWLYQFYISEKKHQVIGKVVKSEDIPAATQLFTPNWIVKYIVQNTLGWQWMATYHNSSLKEKMEFYIEPAEQTPEVQEQLKAITPDNLNPEELTLLDPACGSGHILVEAYDLLKAIYQERGYRRKDIPRLILEKNLYGIEIDDRAAQLAAFALMMKARADDRRIFSNGVRPHVLAIQESKGLKAKEITQALNAPILKAKLLPREFLFEEMEEERAPLFSRKRLSIKGEISQADVAQLIELFEHGKTFGSLIRVPGKLAEKLHAIAGRVEDVLTYGEMFGQAAARAMAFLIEQAQILSRKYDCVITNPPYIGWKSLNPNLKATAKGLYPHSRADLFASFVLRVVSLAKENGYCGFVTPFVWMFISTYREFRQRLLAGNSITTLVQLEYNAFEPTCVPVCTFTLSCVGLHKYRGEYIRLSEFRGASVQATRTKEAIENPKCGWRFTASADDFSKVPGEPIAYWINSSIRNAFADNPSITELATPRQGLATTDNDRFLRRWFEVSFDEIGFSCQSREGAQESGKKWFPYQKGGAFRKWYGNHEFVINWADDGREIKETVLKKYSYLGDNPEFVVKNQKCYFKPGITWSALSSSLPSMRMFESGFIFDAKGQAIFPERESDRLFLLGYLNSRVCASFLRVLTPTLDFNSGYIARLPLPRRSIPHDHVKLLIELSREEWDESELSWNYSSHVLTRFRSSASNTIKATVESFKSKQNNRTARFERLEQLNDETFMNAFGLSKDDVAEYQYDAKTLRELDPKDVILNLLYYAIGCMMGRYSLDKPGLIYAHSGNNGFDPSQYRIFSADQDGIIPITDTDWFEDDAANRVAEFIAVAWPQEHLQENLKFVAESLGPNRGESHRDTLRRYLVTGFYKHHLKTYKKRPIYWLFSSGKQRAFQCLVYLHRYNEGTLSRMRTEYVIPLQGKISARIDQLEKDIKAATSTSSTSHGKRLQRERDKLVKRQAELLAFDEKLRHYADQRISLDLDDGVKVNYGKFGDLLSEVKAVTGRQAD